jgi:hypothetical protein
VALEIEKVVGAAAACFRLICIKFSICIRETEQLGWGMAGVSDTFADTQGISTNLEL